MKDTLILIKNNLQGNNSWVDEVKNQINDFEQKEAKNTMQYKKKKESPQNEVYKQPMGQLQEAQHAHHRGARRRERTRNWK